MLHIALVLISLNISASKLYAAEPKVVNGYVEPTEITRDGDYLIIETKFHIPTKLFRDDYRYIAQPVLIDEDQATTTPLRPLVLNGDRYPRIQRRWMQFGKMEDKLAQYVVDKEITKADNICTYRDSILIDKRDAKLRHSYRAKCYMTLVTYHEPPIFIDSAVIANGVVNPAQHLCYDFEPMQLNNTMLSPTQNPYLLPTGIDTAYIPEYELRIQQRGGVAKIAFNVNSATVNYNNRPTREIINEIKSFLESLQRDKNATIKALSLCGYASPEGAYAKNVNLAQRRTEEVQRIISAKLKPAALESAEVTIDSEVEPWSRVSELLREANPATADKIDEIFAQCDSNYDATNARVTRLAEYRKTIVPHLDELRRVNYSINYTIYKPLRYPAIRQMYDQGKELTKYEYYELISNEPDHSLIPQMESEAVAAFPDFTIFANRAAITALRNDAVDFAILEPLIEQDTTPLPIIYNQAVMALRADSVDIFNRLVERIDSRSEARQMVGAKYALLEDFDKAYDYYAGSATLNEVVLLLEQKRNDEAQSLMEQIMSNEELLERANYCYVYAICHKRSGSNDKALEMLERAISLDASYEQLSQRDGDMWSIYQQINNKTE